MAAGRRAPGIFTLFAFGLLAISIAGAVWWWNRPTPPKAKPLDPSQLDVYCSGRVDVNGMVIPLEPTQPNRVTQVHIEEGATVTQGQVLISLDSAIAKARLLQATAAVDAIDVELAQIQRAKERFPDQLACRQLLLQAAGTRVEVAEKWLQQRQIQQTVSPLGKAELEAMQAQVKELKLLEAAERGQLDDLRKSEVEFEFRLKAAAARKKAAQADESLAAKAVSECELTAPGAGRILRLQATVGAIISPGTPVPPIVFAPEGKYIIRAEVDQEALDRIRPGLAAEVQDENRPDAKPLTGRVKSVSGWVAMRRSMVLEPGEISDVRTVECVIELDSHDTSLWIGQRMRVRILRSKEMIR
ncbi:MAG: HlyD family secretion protein [Fimbriiglobus sp.]